MEPILKKNNSNVETSVPHVVPQLEWIGSDKIPTEMIASNKGHSLKVKAKYSGSRPRLNGGILRRPYEFWYFDFHWGSVDDDGIEHGAMDKRFPMEIHVMFCNTNYANSNDALGADDGLLILVFVCKLTDNENPVLNDLTSELHKIKEAGKSTNVNPFALSSLFDSDIKNYLFYTSLPCKEDETNSILWIISPRFVTINTSQLSKIQSLRGFDNKSLSTNGKIPKLFHRLFNVAHSLSAVRSLLWNLSSSDMTSNMPILQNDINAFIGKTVVDLPEIFVTITIGLKPFVPTQFESETLLVLNDLEERLDSHESSHSTSTIVEKETREKTQQNEKKQLEDSQQPLTTDLVIRSLDTLISDLSCGINTRNPLNDTDAESQVGDKKTKDQVPILISDDVNPKKKSLEEDVQQQLTKNCVIRSLDDILSLQSDDKKKANPFNDISEKIQAVHKITEVQVCVEDKYPKNKSHREGVRMTSAALRRELHIKKKNELRNKIVSKF